MNMRAEIDRARTKIRSRRTERRIGRRKKSKARKCYARESNAAERRKSDQRDETGVRCSQASKEKSIWTETVKSTWNQKWHQDRPSTSKIQAGDFHCTKSKSNYGLETEAKTKTGGGGEDPDRSESTTKEKCSWKNKSRALSPVRKRKISGQNQSREKP
jgi:hypothetical protein